MKPWNRWRYHNLVVENCDYDDVWEAAAEQMADEGYAYEDSEADEPYDYTEELSELRALIEHLPRDLLKEALNDAGL